MTWPEAYSRKAWAICGACGNGFVFAATPCPMEVFILAMRKAFCPQCGERKRIFCADHKPTKAEGQKVVADTAAREARKVTEKPVSKRKAETL